MSSQVAESAIERKRQQNRNSQRTYKKGILKRLEELEKQREASCDDRPTNEGTSHMLRASIGFSQSPSLLCGHHSLPNEPHLVPFSDITNWTKGHTVEHLGKFNEILIPSSPNSTNMGDINAQQDFAHHFLPANLQSQETLAQEHLQVSNSCNNDIFSRNCANAVAAQRVRKKSDSNSCLTSQNRRQSTALHNSVKQGSEAIVRLVVEHGANIHAMDSLGQTPLHIAVEMDHKSIVCYLLEVGSNVNMPDYSGRMPLDTAIASENEQLVQLLLSKGADVNLPCDELA